MWWHWLLVGLAIGGALGFLAGYAKGITDTTVHILRALPDDLAALVAVIVEGQKDS